MVPFMCCRGRGTRPTSWDSRGHTIRQRNLRCGTHRDSAKSPQGQAERRMRERAHGASRECQPRDTRRRPASAGGAGECKLAQAECAAAHDSHHKVREVLVRNGLERDLGLDMVQVLRGGPAGCHGYSRVCFAGRLFAGVERRKLLCSSLINCKWECRTGLPAVCRGCGCSASRPSPHSFLLLHAVGAVVSSGRL